MRMERFAKGKTDILENDSKMIPGYRRRCATDLYAEKQAEEFNEFPELKLYVEDVGDGDHGKQARNCDTSPALTTATFSPVQPTL